MRSAIVFALGVVGCGPAGRSAEVRDLRARLDASEHARGELVQRVDDLDNRLFLLSDQVESQKVALGRRGGAPTLPVITLAPPPSPPIADDLDSGEQRVRYGFPAEERPGGQKLFEESPVMREENSRIEEQSPLPAPERKSPTQARRKVLHLEGRPETSLADAVHEEDGASPSGPKIANLGVVKLPDHGVPLAHNHDSLSTELPQPAAEPLTLYHVAYAKLMDGKTSEAAADFRDFIKRYPRHDLADNAQYWLGETFYARKDYTSAAPEFQSVVVRWPSGNKAPDALLKLGYCLIALGDTGKGRDVLSQVAEHYPRTDAAHLAERRLLELPRTEGPRPEGSK